VTAAYQQVGGTHFRIGNLCQLKYVWRAECAEFDGFVKNPDRFSVDDDSSGTDCLKQAD
jgi:hypothetical protein